MSTVRDHFTTTRAKDMMTRDVVTVYANQQMRTAWEELLEHRISGIPVVSYDETCVGVLSFKDFLLQGVDEFGDDQVIKYMTAPAITISEDHTLLEIVGLFQSRHIHRVPVVDDQGHISGIISTFDIVDQVVHALANESEWMPST